MSDTRVSTLDKSRFRVVLSEIKDRRIERFEMTRTFCMISASISHFRPALLKTSGTRISRNNYRYTERSTEIDVNS